MRHGARRWLMGQPFARAAGTVALRLGWLGHYADALFVAP
jgi:hypothetical protein